MKMQRNLGIDLMRIISMYMIVILHVLGQGGVLWNLKNLTLQYNLAWLLEILCYCSVNCYALITGYVMVHSKFRYKKIIKLWLGVLFWSIILTLTMKVINPSLIGKKDILKSMFPIVFNEYWYFSAYFCLFLFIPFINKFINDLDQFTFRRLIFTIIILFLVVGLITDPFGASSGYSFVWLLLAYTMGAYIKKYRCFSSIKSGKIFLGIILSIFFVFIFKILNIKYPNIGSGLFGSDLFVKYNSLPIMMASVGLFILTLRFHVHNKYFKRFIKRLSPATFGVYIVHTQTWIWECIMKNRFQYLLNYCTSKLFIYVLGYAFIIYMTCSFLELFRIYLFKKINIDGFVDNIYGVLKLWGRKLKI